MELKIELSMLICVFGGFLLFLGVLQPWVDVSSLVYTSYSGWDIMLGNSDLTFIDGFERYAPVMCTINAFAIFMIDSYLVAYKKNEYRHIMSIAIIIFAVASIIMTLFFYGNIPTDKISIGALDFLSYSAGIGLWLSLAGGAVAALGGAYSLKTL